MSSITNLNFYLIIIFISNTYFIENKKGFLPLKIMFLVIISFLW